MKKESRTLYVYSKAGIIVGFLMRRMSFDRVYIGCEGGDFINRISQDPAFKQTRKVSILKGSELSPEFHIFKPEEVNIRELTIIAEEIISSIEKIGGEKICSSAQFAVA